MKLSDTAVTLQSRSLKVEWMGEAQWVSTTIMQSLTFIIFIVSEKIAALQLKFCCIRTLGQLASWPSGHPVSLTLINDIDSHFFIKSKTNQTNYHICKINSKRTGTITVQLLQGYLLWPATNGFWPKSWTIPIQNAEYLSPQKKEQQQQQNKTATTCIRTSEDKADNENIKSPGVVSKVWF